MNDIAKLILIFMLLYILTCTMFLYALVKQSNVIQGCIKYEEQR